MWMLGAFIGLSVGAIASPKLWFVGALIGGALGAWIGRLQKAVTNRELELGARIERLERELVDVRRDIEALRRPMVQQAVAAAASAPAPVARAETVVTMVATTAGVTQPPADMAVDIPAPATHPVPGFAGPSLAPASASAPPESRLAQAAPIEIPQWATRFWAGNPLVKIGVILLFFGVASGLRLAAEYGLFPVPVRLFLAAAAAVGLIGFGFAKVRGDTHRVFGLSLQGGGFALLYLVAYFMLARYAMIGQGLAFVMFALLGVACVMLAAKQDGPALAVLGISGAFLAPVLAGGGSDTPLPLFSYFALLNVFILGIDWFRAWRVLNIAGFIFTLAIGMAWGIDRYEDRHYLVTQIFLVLFLVAYSAMPVLTALFRAPGLKGWREGMLIFGTPVVGSFLQSRLMEGVPYGDAWSALIASLWYAVLWFSLYRENDADNEVVERSHLGLAIAFFTLSIPLAFGAQVTSALWAIEGAAVLWYGVQTRRLLPQMTGLAMQVAAGGALLLGWNELGHRLPVANDIVMGGLLLTLGGLASARMLRSLGADPEFPPAAPFAWALLWWLGVGLGEIHHFAPEHLHASLGLIYLMATVLLLEILAAWWSWPQVRAAAILLLLAMGLAAAHSVAHTGHPLADLLLLVMPVALGLHYGLLLRHERLGTADFADARHLGAYWLTLAVVAGELVWRLHHQWAPANALWPFVALALTLAAGIALPAWGAKKDLWPFAPPEGRYVTTGALLPALVLMGILPWAAVSLSGDGSGLPYLPLLNVFDLSQLAGLAALRTYANAAWPEHRGPLRTAIAGIAFVWLSTLAARIVHAWAGVPFEFAAMMHSTLFQMLLTLFWTVTSITTMILASRRGRRELWFGGFGLLGVVGGKLLLFDAAGRGTLMWTGTLIGVAVLVLAASYFAPLPPRDENSPAGRS